MFQSVQMRTRKVTGRRLAGGISNKNGCFWAACQTPPPASAATNLCQQPAGGDTSFLPSCGRMKCQSVKTKLTGSDCSAAALSGTF